MQFQPIIPLVIYNMKHFSVAILFLLLMSPVSRPLCLRGDVQNQDSDKAELICFIEVPDEVTVVQGRVELHFVMRNVTNREVRITTLIGGGGHLWPGHYEATFSNFWITNRPKPKQIRKGIKSIDPGESVRLPLPIMWNTAYLDEHGSLTVMASYTVGKEFGEAYDVWYGYLKAQPVLITNPKN